MNDADWEDIIKSREMCSSDIMSTILDLHERMIELEHHILNAEPNLITRVYNAEKHLEKLEETNMSAAPVINKILCNMAAQIKFLGEHLEKLESVMPPLNEQIISKVSLLDRIEKLELAFSEHRGTNHFQIDDVRKVFKRLEKLELFEKGWSKK